MADRACEICRAPGHTHEVCAALAALWGPTGAPLRLDPEDAAAGDWHPVMYRLFAGLVVQDAFGTSLVLDLAYPHCILFMQEGDEEGTQREWAELAGQLRALALVDATCLLCQSAATAFGGSGFAVCDAHLLPEAEEQRDVDAQWRIEADSRALKVGLVWYRWWLCILTGRTLRPEWRCTPAPKPPKKKRPPPPAKPRFRVLEGRANG